MPDSTPGGVRIECVVSSPFQQNSYVVWRDGAEDATVVDPGFEPDKIAAALERRGLRLAVQLITHGHSDHIAGIGWLRQRWPGAPVVIGRGDAHKLTDPQANLSAQYGLALVAPAADLLLDAGATYEPPGLGLALGVRLTPGHSPGHVVYVFEERGLTHVLGGDQLFRGSVGRADFADGDFDALRASIHSELFTLPDDAVVYPGHGPTTTIGHEREHNPFVGRAAGYDV